MDIVLVVGGCGCLGHHIVKQLLESGDAKEVHVFDLNTENNLVEGAKYHQGSLTSKSDLLKTLQDVKPLVVYQTASPRMMSQKNPNKLFEEVNINGMKLLVEAIQEVGVTRALIYTGSSSVVHNNYTDLVNVKEDLPLCLFPEQTEYYTHTKAVAEGIVLGANQTGSDTLRTVVLRGTTLFGEGDVTCLPPIIESAKGGKLKFQIGDGTNLFDFTYVGNSAYAHILAGKALVHEATSTEPVADDMKVSGEVFVITNDEQWPFWNFARAVGAAAGYPIKKESVWVIPSSGYYGAAVLAETFTKAFSFGKKESTINRKMVRYLTMTRTFDITKAKTRLGYKPKVSMQEGIERGCNWYIDQQKKKAAGGKA